MIGLRQLCISTGPPVVAIVVLLLVSASSSLGQRERPEKPEPTHKDVSYGTHERKVTDHRLAIDRNFSLGKIIEGDLDGLIDRLIEQAAGLSPARQE